MSRIQRLRAWLSSSMHAALTGGLFLLSCSILVSTHFGPLQALLVLLIGGSYGLAVRAVMGLFNVERWGLIFTGMIAGPIPGIILLSLQQRNWGNDDERGGLWVFAMLLGILIGLVEWATKTCRESEFLE